MRKKSTNSAEYDKELKRVKRLVNSLSKKGIDIPSGIIPQKKKRVTQKALQEIKSITSNTIENVVKKYKRSQASKKAWETRKENLIKYGKYGSYKEIARGNFLLGKEAKQQGIPYQEYVDNYWLNKELERTRQYIQENEEDFIAPPETTSPTNFNIIDVVRSLVDQIPDEIIVYSHRSPVKIETTQYGLADIIDNCIDKYGETAVANYYEANSDALFEALTIWQESSDQDEIVMSFAKASMLLNCGGAFTLEEMKNLGNQNEML